MGEVRRDRSPPEKVPKVGALPRHNMPVESFLVDENFELHFDSAALVAQVATREWISNHKVVSRVAFYPTGLTRFTLSAIREFLSAGITVEVWEWDSQLADYTCRIVWKS